jgi:hypothetical protein
MLLKKTLPSGRTEMPSANALRDAAAATRGLHWGKNRGLNAMGVGNA